MFVLLLMALVLAVPEDLGSTLLAIKKLHDSTPYSTFYEIFGASENTSIDSIRKKYQKMMKKPAPIPGVKDRGEAVTLLTEAYNILKNKKTTYDFILANPYLYLGNEENFKNHLYVLLFSVVAGLVGLDLLCFGIRYLTFAATESERKTSKKKSRTRMHKPSMFIVRSFHSIKSLIKG